MAKSGSFSKTFATEYTLKVAWEELNVDVANNQSDVKCTVTLSADSGYYITSSVSKSISLTINGTKYSSKCTVALERGASKTLMTKTVNNITHGSDGSKSISISCTLDIDIDFTSGHVDSVTKSGTAALTKIARLSSLTASNGTLGTAQTLGITRQDNTFKHKITYLCGDASGYAAGGSDSFTSATSVSWTPPLSFASENTTGTSVSVRLRLYTFTSSGTNLGYTEKTITCTIPSSVAPSCTIKIEDAAGYASTYGWLKGLSKVKWTVTATTAEGSAIASYSVKVKNTTYTTATGTTGALGSSGEITITAKVTDKRGRTGSTSTSITVVDYSAPVISKLVIHRCDADGTENIQGEYLAVSWGHSVTELSSKNTAKLALKYKKTSASSYTSVTLSTSYAATGVKIIAADSGSSWDIILEASDKFKTTTRSTTASTAFAIMHFGADGKAIAFGKIVELDATYDFGLPVLFRQNIKMNEYSDAEKAFAFDNDAFRRGKTYAADKVYPHGCRMYGGNGNSKTGIGWYDALNGRGIWYYNDVDNKIDSDAQLGYGPISVTRNTTNATAVTSDIRFYPFLRMVMFSARFTVAAFNAGDSRQLGTIPSAYAPATVTAALAAQCNVLAASREMSAYCDTTGEIRISVGAAVAAGKYVYLSGMWNY